MTNSRTKGSRFELKIADRLSEWSGLTLRRTPLSGGWAKGSPDVAGDIVSVDDGDFPLHVECKNDESWNWEPTLKGRGVVYKWWKQATDDCPTGKLPFLIFSKAYRDDWLMLYRADLSMVRAERCIIGGILSDSLNMTIVANKNVAIVRFDDFLVEFNYEGLIRALRV